MEQHQLTLRPAGRPAWWRGQVRSGQVRAGQGTGQVRACKGRVGQTRTGQDTRAGHSLQCRAKQSGARQTRTLGHARIAQGRSRQVRCVGVRYQVTMLDEGYTDHTAVILTIRDSLDSVVAASSAPAASYTDS